MKWTEDRKARNARKTLLKFKEKKDTPMRDKKSRARAATVTATTSAQPTAHEILLIAATEIQRQRVASAAVEEVRRNSEIPPDDFEETLDLPG